MASSQVEIASSPRFGRVLRDRNRRDGCRDSNACFQKNLTNFVRDHVNNCISISSDSSSDENRRNQINNVDSLAPKNNLTNLRFNSNNREKGDESSFGSRKHSTLHRWAARQAREIVSTMETEAKLLALPNSEPCKREESPSPSSSCSSSHTRTPSGIPNFAASSLVQIWEKRLNQSNSPKTNASPSNGRSSPSGKSSDNSFSVEEQCIGATSGEPAIVSEEPYPEYESDKTCSLQRQNSDDSAESERVRVADIIKRLTASDDSNDHEQSGNIMISPSRERERTPTPESVEHRVFPQVTTPRLRGRLAFHDLLMQMDRDRHKELDNLVQRASVSKFTQRGRIQSMLKLKLLQRGVAAHGQSRQQSTPSPVSRHPPGSSIMQLRERFIMGAEHGNTTQAEVSEQRIPPSEIANNITQLDNSKNCNQLKKDTPFRIVPSTDNQSTAPTQNSVTQTRADDNKDEARPSLDVTSQVTCSKAKTIDSQKTAETTPAKEIADAGKEQNVTAETRYDTTSEAETHLQNATAEPGYYDTVHESNYQQNAAAETSYDDITEDEEASYQHDAESGYDDEVDASEHNYDETSYDWMSQISRPRSYWEDQRKAWYMEVLDTGSHNEEIRQLLERRTVSTFLASDFRERMDRLMVSHIDTQTHLACGSQDDDEDRRGRMVQLIAFLQEHLHPVRKHEEDGEESRVEEKAEEAQEQQEEEEESLISGQYTNNDVNDYYNQSSSPSSSLLRTWSYRDNETGDDSDRVASPSSPQPSQSHSSRSQSSYQDNRQYSSSANHHSIEMELMCDLRSQMDQLYQEMSELRKSIKSCIDMQMMQQKSMMNREAYTVKNEEKESHDRKRKKGNCCICYEKKVDSLLYRCGHMCTCIKCANDLQWNSGKCPICRAPILDVVRVYVDS